MPARETMEQPDVQDWNRNALLEQALRYHKLAWEIADERACQAARDLAREYEEKAAAVAARTMQGSVHTQ